MGDRALGWGRVGLRQGAGHICTLGGLNLLLFNCGSRRLLYHSPSCLGIWCFLCWFVPLTVCLVPGALCSALAIVEWQHSVCVCFCRLHLHGSIELPLISSVWDSVAGSCL